MDPQSVLSKTAKGKEEVETRKHKLDQRQRMLLITVNGKLNAGELVAQFSKSGDVGPLLDQLLSEGFISEAVDPKERLQRARSEIASALNEALGPEAESIALKVEGAKTLEELRAYLESRRAMLDTALGKVRAPGFWKKVDSLL